MTNKNTIEKILPIRYGSVQGFKNRDYSFIFSDKLPYEKEKKKK